MIPKSLRNTGKHTAPEYRKEKKMNERLFEGFEFSKKTSLGMRGRARKDVGISYQKDKTLVGFCIRNDMTELIIDESKPYIKIAEKKNLLYFMPTESREGYSFHYAGGKTQKPQHIKYASIRIGNMPSSFAKFFDYQSADFDLQYDKKLELYYVDLFEGETHV